MIAVSSKGRSFRALATYLAAGKTGQERERVAWSTARNLPTNDPELAGTIMRATAERSTRVEQPVYHLVLSFDPDDGVDRATMERVADRVLTRIQLHEHQAVIVAHRDREHAHIHILVNRVHPETGLAWEYSFDYRAIQEVLREEERALGIRQVPGRYRDVGVHAGLDAESGVESAAISVVERGQSNPSETAMERRSILPHGPVSESSLERGTGRRSGDESALGTRPEASGMAGRTAVGDQALVGQFVDRVREHAPALRAARSWEEMEVALASHGLRFEPRGQGLLVTDGEHTVKASAIARDLARGRLEERFGKALPTYLAERTAVFDNEMASGIRPLEESGAERARGSYPSSDRVGALQRQLEAYERVSVLSGEHFAATLELNGRRATLAQMETGEDRVRVATGNFERELKSVYRDPVAARAAFETTAADRGIQTAVQAMRDRPQQFGALLVIEESRAFGLTRVESSVLARQAALSAAVRGREAWEARLRLPALTKQHEIRGAVTRAVGRERMAHDALSRGPAKSRLEQEIGHVMRQLLPREIEDLRRAVTRPQFAVAMKIRRAVREALLGREGPER